LHLVILEGIAEEERQVVEGLRHVLALLAQFLPPPCIPTITTIKLGKESMVQRMIVMVVMLSMRKVQESKLRSQFLSPHRITTINNITIIRYKNNYFAEM